MATSLAITLAENDIIKMIEEFFSSRNLDISLMALERESGVINGVYSDDALFLRQLILDGQWDDVIEFLQPLEGIAGYDAKKCLFLIYKHKYLELLCIKQDPGPLQNHDFTLDEVVACLTALEQLSPDRPTYDRLCFLLTLPTISTDEEYRNWNPSSARINCFNELYPHVKKLVALDKKPPSHSVAKNERLVNLLVKGLLFELSVDLCTARACGSTEVPEANHPLGGSTCTDADLSLISWLQKVPSGTFACPFEKRLLKLKLEGLDKPPLVAVWSEQLLVTPIRPKMFPHTAIPVQTKSAQVLSQSMMAMYDGLSSGLTRLHSGSLIDNSPLKMNAVTRSYAAPPHHFLLTNSLKADRRSNPMNQSVEKLFSSESPRPHIGTSPLVRTQVETNPISPELVSPIRQANGVSKFEFGTPDTSDATKMTFNNLQAQPKLTATHQTQSDRTPTIKTHSDLIPMRQTHSDVAPSLNTASGQSMSHSPLSNQRLMATNQTPTELISPSARSGPLSTSSPLKDNPSANLFSQNVNLVPAYSPPASQEAIVKTQSNKPGVQRADVRPGSTQEATRPGTGESVRSGNLTERKPPPVPVQSQNLAEPAKSNRLVVEAEDIRGSKGDLYTHYKEQKQKMEEEFRRLEMRDAEWKTIVPQTNGTTPVGHNSNQTSSHMEKTTPHSYNPVSTPILKDKVEPEQLDQDGGHTDDSPIKQFVAVETLEEQGPVRAVAFHPKGHCYAVGSNSKVLRVCQFPDVSKVTTNYRLAPRKPNVLAKKVKHHTGSIYCVAWNPSGSLLATGSNDHVVKVTQWNDEQNSFLAEKDLSLHDGTIRDVAFLSDTQLLSGGAGDCTVCLTDTTSGKVIRRFKGHDSHILSLYPHCDTQKFVSGGQDQRAIMWDVRMSLPASKYSAISTQAENAFASVCMDPTPRVLAVGHENSHCSIFDLRQGRLLQCWRPHQDEIRSARFNADATYFLTGSYDTTVKLMDMQGDITQPLKTVQVAEHSDKVIQARWHPVLPSFVTSSADKTVSCWAIQIDLDD